MFHYGAVLICAQPNTVLRVWRNVILYFVFNCLTRFVHFLSLYHISITAFYVRRMHIRIHARARGRARARAHAHNMVAPFSLCRRWLEFREFAETGGTGHVIATDLYLEPGRTYRAAVKFCHPEGCFMVSFCSVSFCGRCYIP